MISCIFIEKYRLGSANDDALVRDAIESLRTPNLKWNEGMGLKRLGKRSNQIMMTNYSSLPVLVVYGIIASSDELSSSFDVRPTAKRLRAFDLLDPKLLLVLGLPFVVAYPKFRHERAMKLHDFKLSNLHSTYLSYSLVY